MKKLLYPLLGGVALLLTLLTLLIPRTIDSKDGLQSVHLGYPLPFITQDFSRLDPPSHPIYQYFSSPREFPFTINPLFFLLSYVIIFYCIGKPITMFLRRKQNNL